MLVHQVLYPPELLLSLFNFIVIITIIAINIYIIYITILLLLLVVHTYVHMWRADENSRELNLSFHFYVGSGDRTQATMSTLQARLSISHGAPFNSLTKHFPNRSIVSKNNLEAKCSLQGHNE